VARGAAGTSVGGGASIVGTKAVPDDDWRAGLSRVDERWRRGSPVDGGRGLGVYDANRSTSYRAAHTPPLQPRSTGPSPSRRGVGDGGAAGSTGKYYPSVPRSFVGTGGSGVAGNGGLFGGASGGFGSLGGFTSSDFRSAAFGTHSAGGAASGGGGRAGFGADAATTAGDVRAHHASGYSVGLAAVSAPRYSDAAVRCERSVVDTPSNRCRCSCAWVVCVALPSLAALSRLVSRCGVCGATSCCC
jgi:hypothetical protein